ncbi:MAG: helix-turn-helix domain-containing protein [bacterium]
MKIENILTKYGLTEQETTIYLSLLKHVEATAFQLAKETGIPRATTYRILDSLRAMKMVSVWKKNNISYFNAESPKRLLNLLDEKKELLNSILPEIMNLRKIDTLTPTTKIFEGKEGLKIAWDDILDTAERKDLREIHAISGLDVLKYLPRYFPEWLKRREKLGVFSYVIARKTDSASDPTLVKNRLRETRILPTGAIGNGTIDIYGDKIAFFSLKDEQIYSIILESPSIAEFLRNFFISAWGLLE